MGWKRRAVAASVVGLLMGFCACKHAKAPVAPQRNNADLLAQIPARVAAVVWAADFDAGISGVTNFAAAAAKPNALKFLDAFVSTTGVDLRTAEGWESAGVDTHEGIVLLMGSAAFPTLVVRTRDPVRFDKFVNLFAESRDRNEGHAIGAAHGSTVHSYRGVHWAHVGSYAWLTLDRDGRVGMDHVLQHIKHEDGVVVPDHPLATDAGFLRDMNQVRAATWMGWRGVPLGARGPWALALDLGKQGAFAQLFVGTAGGSGASQAVGPAAAPGRSTAPLPAASSAGGALPAGAPSPASVAPAGAASASAAPAAGAVIPTSPVPLDTLMARMQGEDVLFAALPWFGLEDVATLADLSVAFGDVIDANKLATDTAGLDEALLALTGLHWRTDVAPDVRGVTFGVGPHDANLASLAALDVAVGIEMTDAAHASHTLTRAVQTLGEQHLDFRANTQSIGTAAVTVYQRDHVWPAGRGGSANDVHIALRLAQVGNTIVVAAGPHAFDNFAGALFAPAHPRHALLQNETIAHRVAAAQQAAVVRLAYLGDIMGKQVAAPVSAWLAGAQAVSLIGDVLETAQPVAGGWLVDISADLTTTAPAPTPTASRPPLAHPTLPELAMLPLERDRDRYWLHTPVSRTTSFVNNVRYVERVFLSQPDAVRACRRSCWDNSHCLGFFEQTKTCPEPHRNDHRSDPTRNRGRGCVRLCGFYTEGQNPLQGTLSGGAAGAVWLKSDLFGKGIAAERWLGPQVLHSGGP